MPGVAIETRLTNGISHICYEQVLLLAGFLEMTKPHPCPRDLLIQDGTLTHLRVLAESFWWGKGAQPGSPPRIDPKKPDLFARCYCDRRCWDPSPFDRSSNLMRDLDKCVAHLSLARVLSDAEVGPRVAWDGPTHLHGTAMLKLRTWEGFVSGVRPEFRPHFERWLAYHAKAFGISLATFDSDLTRVVSSRAADGFQLDTVP